MQATQMRINPWRLSAAPMMMDWADRHCCCFRRLLCGCPSERYTAQWTARSRHALGGPAFDAADAAGRALDLDAAMLELQHRLQRAA
jgi:hypothetical protein